MNELNTAVSEGGEIFVLGSLWQKMGVRDGIERERQGKQEARGSREW